MSEVKVTLGHAIDQIVAALEALPGEARLTAIFAVCKHLNINVSSPAQVAVPSDVKSHGSSGSPLQAGVESAPSRHVDIRKLKEEKKPASAKQMACIVAYYLQELAPPSEKKETIGTPDIEKYFKQAHFKLPQKINQILVDAKRSGYFESAERGEYKLNAVGYNLVVHSLPSQTQS